jgi:hypothetical protein
MNTHPSFKSVWPVAWLMASVLAAGASNALAQAAAPRYTYRELPTPRTAIDCGYRGHGVPLQVNLSGTVVGTCQFVKGYTTTGNLARCGFTDTLCNLLHPLVVPVRYPMLVQWPANGGAPRLLSLPNGQDKRVATNYIGLTDRGDVYASSWKTSVLGAATSGARPYQLWVWKGQGGAPVMVKPPLATAGLNHELLQVTSTGRMLWRASAVDEVSQVVTAQQVVLSAPGEPDRILQDLPASLGAARFGFEHEINDQGHVLQKRKVKQVDNGTRVDTTEYWFDQGQGWQALPSPTSRRIVGAFYLKGLSNQDTLLVPAEGAPFLWNLLDPTVNQPLPEALYQAVSPQGVPGGYAFMPQSSLAPNLPHGVVVIGGARLDLNDVTSGLPAGWLVSEVHSINGKGQIVVEMRDLTKKPEESGKAIRVGILTPQ